MPSAPLAASSQSRKKLKTFKYAAKQAAADNEKENAPLDIHQDDDAENRPGVEDAVHEAHTEPAYPQTPAVRIPIEDLIGNTEDAFNCPPPVTTPGDHVLWQNGP